MSEKEHKRHNHFHFGFFMVAAVAICFVFAVSGEKAADEGDGDGKAFKFARAVAHFIFGHWWIVPLALLPFWVIHFLYSEWRFLKHVYHLILLGMGAGFVFLYFQLDKRLMNLFS
ncbi:MAG: hypothetical protein ACYTHM_03030 [Planctomycetota bacterium]